MTRQVHRVSMFSVAVLGLTVLLMTGGPSFAGESADPDSYRSYDVGDGLVTIDVQDAVLGQVVAERIQPRTRVNIIVAPEAAEQRVSLRVVDLHWVQALSAMVERIGGVMVRKANNLLRIERPQPVSFTFTDEDVRNVIITIAEYSSANVIISPEVDGHVTLSLNETPWRAALEQVVRTVGYALVEEDYGILRVVPVTELELETGYYRFRYMRPPPPYKGIVTNQAWVVRWRRRGRGAPPPTSCRATSTSRRTTRPRSRTTSRSSTRCARWSRPRTARSATSGRRTP